MLRNVYVTVSVGQSVRDFLILGTVARLVDYLPDYRIVILTPAYNVPEFYEVCPKHERVLVRRMEVPTGGPNSRLIHWRRKLRHRTAIGAMLRLEAQRHRLAHYLVPTFEEFPPSLVVSTHPMVYHDYEIVMWARRNRIQTLGVVKSWDNVGKGLASHCHLLSVWNPVNKAEAVRLRGYRPEEVEVNGAVSFDAYYDPDYDLPREDALRLLGMDPARPVITVATCGSLDKGFYGRDETHLVDDVLRMMRESRVLKGAQLVIRLHPTSRLEFFWKYWNQPNIKISFATTVPGLMWCPSRQDLLEQTILLRHSTVVVTPASSWGIEAAIFDTPTVVPIYSDLQPDHADALFNRWTLTRHYRPLAERKWIPITRSYQETCSAIEEAFTEPGKWAKARQAIRDTYIYYQDCDSSRRVAQWIAGIAQNVQPGKPRGY